MDADRTTPPKRCTNCRSRRVEQDPNSPSQYDCMACGMCWTVRATPEPEGEQKDRLVRFARQVWRTADSLTEDEFVAAWAGSVLPAPHLRPEPEGETITESETIAMHALCIAAERYGFDREDMCTEAIREIESIQEPEGESGEAEHRPRPGELWRHYKGGVYQVEAIGRVEATTEEVVVYRSLTDEVWTRPLSEWTETVKGKSRFRIEALAAPTPTKGLNPAQHDSDSTAQATPTKEAGALEKGWSETKRLIFLLLAPCPGGHHSKPDHSDMACPRCGGSCIDPTAVARYGPALDDVFDEHLRTHLSTPTEEAEWPYPAETDMGAAGGALEWALDIIDMYDQRLAESDGPAAVFSETHVAGKEKARRALERVKRAWMAERATPAKEADPLGDMRWRAWKFANDVMSALHDEVDQPEYMVEAVSNLYRQIFLEEWTPHFSRTPGAKPEPIDCEHEMRWLTLARCRKCDAETATMPAEATTGAWTTLGAIVRHVRVWREVSLRHAAQELGMTHVELGEIERGVRDPTAVESRRLRTWVNRGPEPIPSHGESGPSTPTEYVDRHILPNLPELSDATIHEARRKTMADETRDAIEQLRRAVQDEGRAPAHHAETERRHRKEWPTLWAAIDRILMLPDTTEDQP